MRAVGKQADNVEQEDEEEERTKKTKREIGRASCRERVL